MKYYLTPNLVPPGGWQYLEPNTGKVIEGPSALVLKAKVEDFLVANGLKIPQGLPQLIAEQTCARVPEFCGDTEPPTFAERVATFSRALSGWAQGGLGLASPETIAAREDLCKQCELYKGDRGLGFVACGKCGCSSVKLFLPDQKCPHPSGAKW